MLVLTRKVGESILIDNGQIEVKVLSSKGNTVALGVNAPSQVTIDRMEIHLLKQESRQAEKNNEAA